MDAANPAYLEVIDFLAEKINPETLIAFRPSTGVQERVSALIARNGEDLLSAEEKQELSDYLQLEHLMVMAKAEARRKLQMGA
jgi:hypothetical protein